MRVLVVGGGCRATLLARGLVADDHAVRIVTRTEARRASIEAAGAECWIGDPGVVGTLRYALDNVTVLMWLLGTATGEPEDVLALHDSRLAMMLARSVDTTVRGVVYEAAGTVDAWVLAGGVEQVRRANEIHELPYTLVEADPGDPESWVSAAREAITGVLQARA